MITTFLQQCVLVVGIMIFVICAIDALEFETTGACTDCIIMSYD